MKPGLNLQKESSAKLAPSPLMGETEQGHSQKLQGNSQAWTFSWTPAPHPFVLALLACENVLASLSVHFVHLMAQEAKATGQPIHQCRHLQIPEKTEEPTTFAFSRKFLPSKHSTKTGLQLCTSTPRMPQPAYNFNSER